MPRRAGPHREPPPELDQDMRRADLVDVLRELTFEHSAFSTIQIDEPVRDYLIGALSRHPARRS